MFNAQKDPDATLDYGVDWSKWLASSETISTSTWIVDVGLTASAETNTSTVATVWLSGGAAGTEYLAVNRIVTNQGRTDDRTVKVLVLNR